MYVAVPLLLVFLVFLRILDRQLQKAQFDFWYKEGMGPKYIVTNVFKEADENSLGQLGRSIMSQYRTYLSTNHPDWTKNVRWQ